MSVYIAYPHTSASAIIGQKCITNLFSVNFFMPNRVDETIGGDILKDIEILASLSDDSDVERTDIPDFSAPDVNVVFFPCLDVLPDKSRSEYGTMVKNLFKLLKTQGMKFNSDGKIVFGRNVAGLIAARELVLEFPDVRENICVVSSIYYASKKVFGDEQGGFGNQMARAFPVQDLPGQMSIAYSTGRSSPKIGSLDEVWAWDQHTLLEGMALSEVLNTIKNQEGDFSEMEVIGKFPSESERKKYDLDMDSPVWLPTNGEVLNGAIAKAMKSLSDWLKNGYKD